MNKELLYKYFSDKATYEEEKLILDWVDTSAENYKEFLKERKIWNAVIINSNGEQQFIEKKKQNPINWWRLSTIMTATVACVALLFSLSSALFNTSTRKSGIHTIIVPPGQRTQLILEDGTIAWLNARTVITYPATFESNSRNITLDGEGYFEVKPDKDRPFIIETEKYNVNVIGTTINVYAYRNSSNPFELSLLTGKVNIDDKKGNIQNIQLKSNEYAIEEEGKLRKDKIMSLDRFRWKDGLICLDDEPFEVLMKKFSGYYDIQIIVQNKNLYTYRCTGKFRMSDGIDYALRVLKKDVKFNYTRNDDTNSITIF